MEIDRKLVAELAVSAAAIVVFVVAASVVSQEYAAPTNATSNASTVPAITSEGGLAMVGVVAVFVLVMAVAGLLMYWTDFDEEE